MANPGVKILFSSSHSALERELGGWLTQVAGQVRITSLSMDSNDYGHCLAVMYEREAGPAYYGRVLFSQRHSALEAAANEALAAATGLDCQFMTIGSNQYGHCLCVIGAAGSGA